MSNWRVGRKVPLNVYRDDAPWFQCHTPEAAAEVTVLLTAGEQLPWYQSKLAELERKLAEEAQRIAGLLAERDEARVERDEQCELWVKKHEENTALLQQVDALSKDKQRLDWLEAHRMAICRFTLDAPALFVPDHDSGDPVLLTQGNTIREVIDAAMQEQPSPQSHPSSEDIRKLVEAARNPHLYGEYTHDFVDAKRALAEALKPFEQPAQSAIDRNSEEVAKMPAWKKGSPKNEREAEQPATKESTT